MDKQIYKKVEIEIIVFSKEDITTQDIISASYDSGEWDDNWGGFFE